MSVDRLDWQAIEASLDERGWAMLPGLLSPAICAEFTAMFEQGRLFRSKVVMQRHGYGRGVYQYFAYPLPERIERLRRQFYPPLAAIANRWQKEARFPDDHAAYLARCRKAGQTRPTPLILRYGPGDYNCLHQDLYGGEVFPLQLAILLSRPGEDFTGGEFVLTEQRPRRQSRPSVVPLSQGDGVIFPVQYRPVPYRATMRHGVAEIRSGQRHTLGVIFHDAA
jgi:hypothetical protein